MAAAILAATAGLAVRVDNDLEQKRLRAIKDGDPISDEDFIKAYNALETPVEYRDEPPKPKPRKYYARTDPSTENREHEKRAWENRKNRDKGDSLLAKARRAKGRR